MNTKLNSVLEYTLLKNVSLQVPVYPSLHLLLPLPLLLLSLPPSSLLLSTCLSSSLLLSLLFQFAKQLQENIEAMGAEVARLTREKEELESLVKKK
jgi:hypothetical protein